MTDRAVKIREKSKELAPGLIIAGFIILICLCVASALALVIVLLSYTEDVIAAVNIGISIMGVVVCTALYYGCMRDERMDSRYSSRPFIIMVFIVAVCFTADQLFWCAEGYIELRELMTVVGTLKNIFELVLTYSFWRYARNILDVNGKIVVVFDWIAKIGLIPSSTYVLVNIFNPTVFSIDADGLYYRLTDFDYSNIYVFLIYAFIIVIMIMSHVTSKVKGSIVALIIFPGIHYLISFGFSIFATQDAAMLLGIILMYTFLFSEQGNMLVLKDNELGLANDIQSAMLPNNFPYFKRRSEFDIYASMTPAREVGGDYFDFYLLDDDHLCMSIGDVAGKGVPAALFMVSSKTNIARFAKGNMSPAKILEGANREICAHNEQMLFVSVWIGILEISTGKLICANAGHEYPAIMLAGKPFEIYHDAHGVVLGAVDDATYEDYELQLTPGSKVFVYTDGVAEATNHKKELYGTDRLIDSLNECEIETPEGVLYHVQKDVDKYAKDSVQSDDITMLCIEYYGASEKASHDGALEVTLEADVGMLHDVQTTIRRQANTVECNEQQLMKLDLIVEEIFVNIASYAYTPYKGDVTIISELVDDNKTMKVTFIDSGREYNPLAKEDPDISAAAEDRVVGGLGIYMTKQLADNIEYEYINMKNKLTVYKKLA